MFKSLLRLVLIFVLLFSIGMNPYIESKAHASSNNSDKYYDQIIEVTQSNISVNDKGIVTYNLEAMEEELKDNPYKNEALTQAKMLNNKSIDILDSAENPEAAESNNRALSTQARIASPDSRQLACGIQGKKVNTKYYQSLDACVGKKVKSLVTLGGLLSGFGKQFIDDVANGKWKNVRTTLGKAGKSSASIGGIVVTLATIQYTCIKAAQKKYPPGGCK
ncbi:hypothetical protein [Macrococcus carouselicus]|uniref:Uncharacterized protein n=1 Tax=Macrococcus carouselicus TaxID=69969 RepID=A0A9Q8CC88_9STAP|nr:hypothetical protein [Macrococcus carouselicus]TDL95552.1 hypothetical protein ERX40_10235 [Macrococcus carouselicus]